MPNLLTYGILAASLVFPLPAVAQDTFKIAALQTVNVDSRIANAFAFEPVKTAATPTNLLANRSERIGRDKHECGAVDGATVTKLVRTMAKEEGIDPDLADAVAWVESQHGRARKASSAGAMGIMQLMPETADAMGVTDRCDVEANIRGGVKYLKTLYAEFGDPLLMLAAYNAGPGNIYKKQGIPEFEETTRYIIKVLNRWKLSAMVVPKQTALVAQKQPDKISDNDGEGNNGNVWKEAHVIEVQ